MMRFSSEPLTQTKSNIDRCCTYSHSPTPPACGQTGMPNFAASRSTAMHLVHAAQPARVDLAEGDRVRLHELLEDDPILAVLSRGDADRRDGARDRRVAEHVVRARRLLDPPGIEPRQLAHARDRLVHLPDLVRVDHQLAVGADLLADERGAAHVVGEIASDLDLEVRPAARPSPRGRGGGSSRRDSRASRRRWCTQDSRRARSSRSRSARVGAWRRRMSSASSGVSASVM